MSTHVYNNTRLGLGFGKAMARLYQRMFISTFVYVNYQTNYVILIPTLLNTVSTFKSNPLNYLGVLGWSGGGLDFSNQN
jgi:hypothetical protein